jgi:membrane-associated phospholipid phosphatase
MSDEQKPEEEELTFIADEDVVYQPATESNVLWILSTIISYVFHPILLATYAFVYVDVFFPYQFLHLSPQQKTQLMLTIVTNTLVFPVIVLALMRGLKMISSFELRTNKERIIPFIAISLFYFWTYLVVQKLGVGHYFSHISLGASLGIFMAFFANVFYKISIHAVGVGGFFGVALTLTLISTYNLLFPLLLVIIVVGAVGSARLFLGAHTPREVISGYMVGLLGQMVAFAYF